jgi:hypothetical protein
MAVNVKLIVSALLFAMIISAAAWGLQQTNLSWLAQVGLLLPVAVIVWMLVRLVPKNVNWTVIKP